MTDNITHLLLLQDVPLEDIPLEKRVDDITQRKAAIIPSALAAGAAAAKAAAAAKKRVSYGRQYESSCESLLGNMGALVGCWGSCESLFGDVKPAW